MTLRRSAALFLVAMMTAVSGCSAIDGVYPYTRYEAKEITIVCQAVVTDVKTVDLADAVTSYRHTVGGEISNVTGAGQHRTLTIAAKGDEAPIPAGTQGLQYTVLYDSGEKENIIQGMEPAYAVGQRVRVVTGSSGAYRIQPIL